MRSRQEMRIASIVLALIACGCLIAVVTSTASSACKVPPHLQQGTTQPSATAQSKPLPAPERWRGLIGEYGPDDDILIILEKDGKICALFKRADLEPLDEGSKNVL